MEWQHIFKVLKGKNLQPRLLYPARVSFKIDGEIKSFLDKQKLREFSMTKPALRQHIYGSCFCIHLASLCLLVGAFNPFTFKVTTDIYVPIAIS